MTAAIAKIPTAAIASGSLTEDQVELIRKTLCKGASNDELALFVATANRLGLDPFARQIFAVKRGNNSAMSIQVSIDGFRLVADRTERYAPGRPTEYEHDDQGKLVSATAYVKKLAAGAWHEIGETSFMVEYQSIGTPVWKSMPRVMLAKTAEARALRRAFPAELSGVYAPEEMDQAQPPAVVATKPVEFVEAEVVGESTVDVAKALASELVQTSEIGELVAFGARLKSAGLDQKSLAELRALYSSHKRKLEQAALQVEADEMAADCEEAAS